MIDFRVAYDKLAGFETADEIAGLFKDYGVQAEMCEPHACAITVWMEEQTGLDIATGVNTVKVIDRGVDAKSYEYEIIEEAYHTRAMVDFVGRFDNNNYPELVKGYLSS